MTQATPKYQKHYHVKKGDSVGVITGKWKGEQGKILAVLKKKDRVVLELQGLSSAKRQKIGMRTLKKTQSNPKGGLVERSVSIHVSNVRKQEEQKAAKPKAKASGDVKNA